MRTPSGITRQYRKIRENDGKIGGECCGYKEKLCEPSMIVLGHGVSID